MTFDRQQQAASATADLFRHLCENASQWQIDDEKQKLAYALGFFKEAYANLLSRTSDELFLDEIGFIKCVTKK